MSVKFPPVEFADESGLLAIGGDLDVDTLELAYRNGIFPWPVIEEPLLWFAPPQRAILEFDELHIPRRLQRSLRKADFTFDVNTDFPDVIRACARTKHRKGQRGTWITEDMVQAYIEFHRRGFAHSFEVVNSQGDLVGGLYGVWIGHYFAGESMFYKESNASKFALIKTVDYLKKRGLSWMDVQVLTPLLVHFGAKEIPRFLFMKKLQRALFEE
ncbi:leucyl/phenylalanyl-tRNA--protein transferase [candidate division KSB1 bacterium]|nr:leucyl/phenylalanyl-tRNA--protein transferase [candidate division KSB1 bacterium]NIR70469.1 leucyl/phenylalanyl-tRNA--protein transferase [candidate division KSB1 bacterium]NIS23199.1 leucyl/phenylalanyl-tRNA--protein transferase [candidate division KSB1 bacterium]NIT70059.1 leucyl/phenylalanyl-tRNA--protein transferase [candidate division KSB1 bacterium]NIU23696.1 leucyl/phenylalanyl-tRNA--protein transferase [candidate division KSB1 bacterium]